MLPKVIIDAYLNKYQYIHYKNAYFSAIKNSIYTIQVIYEESRIFVYSIINLIKL